MKVLAMSKLRKIFPWIVAGLAVAWAGVVSLGDTPWLMLGLAVVTGLVLVIAGIVWVRRRRQRRLLTTPSPGPTATHKARPAALKVMAAALSTRPKQGWLVLGLPGHGKTSVLRQWDPHYGRGQTAANNLQISTSVGPHGRLLVVEHPGTTCDLEPLRRHPGAVHAVLLVVDVTTLTTTGPQQLARTLEPLCKDLQQQVSRLCPVYVVCTKLDRIAGYTEFMAEAPTLLGDEFADLAALGHDHQRILDWLRSERLERIANTQDPQLRARLFTFAASLQQTYNHIRELLEQLCRPDGGWSWPLRGFYAVAAAPEATHPEHTHLLTLAERLHTRLVSDVTATKSAAPVAVDLSPMFRSFWHRASEAAWAPAGRRKLSRRRHLLAASLCIITGAVTLVGTSHARHLRERLQTLAEIGGTLHAPDPTPPLMRLRAELDAWREFHGPLHRWLAPSLARELQAVFRHATRERLLATSALHLQRTLERPGTDTQRTRDRLRAYLLLTTSPATASEPDLGDANQLHWLQTELPLLVPQLPASEFGLLTTTLHALATPGDLKVPRDIALVERVRGQLLAADDEDDLLLAALAAVDASCEPLTVASVTHASHLSGKHALACSFTRRGWPRVHTRLEQTAIRRDAWVLGLPTQLHADDDRLARLRQRYESRYIAAWIEFLAGLHLQRQSDLPGASRLFAELTADDRPLRRIFQALEDNTRGLQQLRLQDRSVIDFLHQADHPSRSAAIVRTFAPLLAFVTSSADQQSGLERYHARLEDVQAALAATLRDPAAASDLQTAVQTAISDTHTMLLRAELRQFHPVLSNLILPPLESLQDTLLHHDKFSLVRAYCQEISKPLGQMLRAYPFARGAHEDVSLAEFTAFFQPEHGSLRRFRETYLGPYITVQGPEISAKPRAKTEKHPLHPAVVAFLQRATELGHLAFPDGDQLGFAFAVDLHCNPEISRVSLRVDGVVHAYTCGSGQHMRMQWPQPEADPGAAIELVGRDGRRETIPGPGPWGFWRLLEKDDLVIPPSDYSRPQLMFRLDLRASRLGQLNLSITPARDHGASLMYGDPLTPALLAPLRAPALQPPPALFVGLPTCADLQ